MTAPKCAIHRDHAYRGKSNLLNDICDVGPGECEILKSTDEAPVGGGVNDRSAIARVLGLHLDRGHIGLQSSINTLEDV